MDPVDPEPGPASTLPPRPVVDAHLHQWDPATGWYGWLDGEPDVLRRRFEPAEAAAAQDALGVVGSVLVQAADCDADTDAMLERAHSDPRVLGVVGYLPLERPAEAAERLAVLQADPAFVGVRTLVHDQPDPDWLLRPDVAQGLALLEAAGVPFDLVAVLPRHLEHVGYLATRFPALTVVLDHLRKPPVGTDRREPWATELRRAAEHPRLYAKLSGLYPVQGRYDDDAVRPWMAEALDCLGPQRCLVGSDWPVAELCGGYARVLGAVLRVVDELLPEADADRVRAGTAAEVYRLRMPVDG